MEAAVASHYRSTVVAWVYRSELYELYNYSEPRVVTTFHQRMASDSSVSV